MRITNMYTYHVSTMSTASRRINYNDYVVEWSDPIGKDNYQEFRQWLVDNNFETGDFVITSLNLISSPAPENIKISTDKDVLQNPEEYEHLLHELTSAPTIQLHLGESLTTKQLEVARAIVNYVLNRIKIDYHLISKYDDHLDSEWKVKL